MFNKIIMTILAVFFPWLVLCIYDNPVGAVITLILQATIIGWIPASIWAVNVVRAADHKKAQTNHVEEKE